MNAAIQDPSGSLSGLRTFFIVVGAAVAGLVLLTVLTATFVIPKAAEQLEADARRLRPGLWEEYEARLDPEETLATRPDLLQELGNVMRPIILDDYEAKANDKFPDPKNPLEPKSTGGGKVVGTVDVDVNDQWKD